MTNWEYIGTEDSLDQTNLRIYLKTNKNQSKQQGNGICLLSSGKEEILQVYFEREELVMTYVFQLSQRNAVHKRTPKDVTCLSALSNTLYNKGGIKFSTAFPTSLRKESLAGRQLG